MVHRNWLVACLALVALACGDDAGQIAPSVTADGSGGMLFGDAGVAADVFIPVGDGGGANPAHDGAAADGLVIDGPVDAGLSGCEFAVNADPGEPGAPCSSPDQCDSGWCVDGAAGKVCSRTCVECCPGGWKCEQAPSGDAVFICLPKLSALCLPCSDDDACGALSGGALCVRYGDGEAHFCGGHCDDNSDCPGGFSCKDASGTQGQAKQCVRNEGLCPCSAKAAASGATSLCAVKSAFGSCVGSRKCTSAGLTECDVAAAAAEICNGADDDCDGMTDEEVVLSGCPVGNSYGTCPGSQSCVGGQLACDGKTPAPEVCDGQDNNCDGLTDEGCDADGDGFCAVGVTIVGLPAACSQDLALCNSGGLALPAWCAKGVLDCDDKNDKVHPSQPEVCGNLLDDDCDGETDVDADGSSAGLTGCKTFYGDVDTDGFGNLESKCLCAATGTWTADNNGDCDDKDAKVNPNQKEICANGKDDDCDLKQNGYGAVNCVNFWADGDGDGFGFGQPACACAPLDQFKVQNKGDCDDTKAAVHPKAEEICDTLDNNCDGQTDEADAKGCKTWYADADKDTYGDPVKSACLCGAKAPYVTQTGGDCDDGKYNVNPGFPEYCGDNLDNDCSGETDEENGKNCTTFYFDGDGDKFGANGKSKCLCSAQGKYNVSKFGDCVDDDSTIYPEANELCDDIDNDCDQETDEGCNVDGDGYCAKGKTVVGKPKTCPDGGGDCHDGDKAIYPGAAEVCDSKDNNCQDGADEGCDDDNDDYCDKNMAIVGKPSTCSKGGGDCHDGETAIHPGASEVCDNIDNNCKDGVDEACNVDGDGYCAKGKAVVGKPNVCKSGGGDCHDGDKTIYPGAKEVCDNKDNNCVNGVDEGCDDDNDGYCDKNMTVVGTPSTCLKGGGDCQDGNKYVNPAAEEICDNIDNNCKSGADEGCDDDNDNYCDKNMTVVGKPKTCTYGGGDCCDIDSKTRPGQTSYYSTKNLCNSFDYNCVGGWEKKLVIVAKPSWKCGGFACTKSSCNASPAGWDISVPACGVSKLWITDYDWNGKINIDPVKVCKVKIGDQMPQSCR